MCEKQYLEQMIQNVLALEPYRAILVKEEDLINYFRNYGHNPEKRETPASEFDKWLNHLKEVKEIRHHFSYSKQTYLFYGKIYKYYSE